MGRIQNMAKRSYKVTSGNIKPGIPRGKGPNKFIGMVLFVVWFVARELSDTNLIYYR